MPVARMGAMEKHPQAKPGASKEEQRFFELVRTFHNAMLVTHMPDGTPHARPMALADVTEQGELWFVSRRQSPKVDEVVMDNRALVVAQESGKYLTVTGHAEVRKDPQKVAELWSERFRPWFNDKNDPNLVLICVRGEEAEYWDNSGYEGLKFFVKAATAYVTGKKLGDGAGDPQVHGKVRL
jgi:general stress protein 26